MIYLWMIYLEMICPTCETLSTPGRVACCPQPRSGLRQPRGSSAWGLAGETCPSQRLPRPAPSRTPEPRLIRGRVARQASIRREHFLQHDPDTIRVSVSHPLLPSEPSHITILPYICIYLGKRQNREITDECRPGRRKSSP